ncbi:MAG: hypothetical protein SGBAC_004482 [Bacillariaceae sp.]
MTLLAGKWKSDGSDDPSFGGKQMAYSLEAYGEDSQVLTVKAIKTLPSNFLYELETSANAFFLQITVNEKSKFSSLSVGVAKLSSFKPGYGTNGMLYNGNLTNGMALLKGSFGPSLKEGDTAIVEFMSTKDFIEVTYYLNGEILGAGFRVPKEVEAFHPLVSMTGTVTLRAMVTTEIPPRIVKSYTDPTSMRQSFILAQANDESGKTIIPAEGGDTDIKVTINPTEEDTVTLTVVVCNIMSIRKKFITTESGIISLLPIEGHDVVCSTRSKARPPYNVVEPIIREYMASVWASINISSDGKELTILNANGESMATGEKLVRDRKQPALTSYAL